MLKTNVAKSLMLDNLHDNVAIAELAHACSLSRPSLRMQPAPRQASGESTPERPGFMIPACVRWSYGLLDSPAFHSKHLTIEQDRLRSLSENACDRERRAFPEVAAATGGNFDCCGNGNSFTNNIAIPRRKPMR
jgi:hypothetical protein